MLLYIDKVTTNKEAFEKKVIQMGKDLAVNPDALMFVMNVETGGTFNPAIQNTTYPLSGGYATGLFQFTPQTAIGLGTTVEALKKMSNVEQLDYAYKMYKRYAGRMDDFADAYMVTFFPAALNWPADRKLETSTLPAAAVAGSNPAFDLNKDKAITVGEFRQWVQSKLPPGYKADPNMNPGAFDKAVAYTKQPTNWWKIGTAIAILGAMYYFGKKAKFF